MKIVIFFEVVLVWDKLLMCNLGLKNLLIYKQQHSPKLVLKPKTYRKPSVMIFGFGRPRVFYF
jgi:hypothetical protein